jgi:hypothetical protein
MKIAKLFSALGLFSTAACSQSPSENLLTIINSNFSLELEAPWVRLPNEDPEQYNFRDSDRDVDITLSAMGMRAKPNEIELVASKLIEIRLKAEGQMADEFGIRLTIAEPINVVRPWGRAIAYYGSDHTGRQFSYSGMVTTHTVINLYMSTKKLTESELMTVMNEVGSKIQFDRTPISGSSESGLQRTH